MYVSVYIYVHVTNIDITFIKPFKQTRKSMFMSLHSDTDTFLCQFVSLSTTLHISPCSLLHSKASIILVFSLLLDTSASIYLCITQHFSTILLYILFLSLSLIYLSMSLHLSTHVVLSLSLYFSFLAFSLSFHQSLTLFPLLL